MKLDEYQKHLSKTLQDVQKTRTYTCSYTLEMTERRHDEDGDAYFRTISMGLNLKRKTTRGLADAIGDMAKHYLKKPYVVDLKVKDFNVLGVPMQDLDATLEPMYASAPLIMLDRLELDQNFHDIEACVPLTLFERYAKTETNRSNKRLKLDMEDVLEALNEDVEITDDNFDELLTKGYTAVDVQNFCERTGLICMRWITVETCCSKVTTGRTNTSTR